MTESSITQPEIITRQTTGLCLRLTLRIPRQLVYFSGHFPESPILPGVVQLHWAIAFAREQWPVIGEFERLEAVKFQHIIGADQQITLDLEWDPERRKLGFRFSGRELAHSSGRVVFARE